MLRSSIIAASKFIYRVDAAANRANRQQTDCFVFIVDVIGQFDLLGP